MKKEDFYSTDYDINEIEDDERLLICKKEMKLVFFVQLMYTFILILVAYFLGKGDPKHYTYILGLPLWWFTSLALTFLFLFVIMYIVKYVFVDFDLND